MAPVLFAFFPCLLVFHIQKIPRGKISTNNFALNTCHIMETVHSKEVLIVKTKLNKVMAHVERNRGKYAMLATASAFVVLMRAQAKQFNAFLADHNLMDEYYNSLED